MKPEHTNRDEHPQPADSGREHSTRNAAPRPGSDPLERAHQPQDDLFLHDDDEAELELPR